MFRLSLLPLLLSCLVTPLAGQGDLREDADYFRQQADVYGRWLASSGLGQYLSVEDLVVEADEVNLFLNLGTTDIDRVVSRWEALERQTGGTDSHGLEQTLFYKARTIFRVPITALSVEVYDNYDQPNVNFQRTIYYANGLRVEREKSLLKSKVRRIALAAKPVAEGGLTRAEFDRRYSRERVFTCLRSFARARYERLTCERRKPTMEIIGDDEGNVLQFEVIDLCREVLRDQQQHLVCGWLRRLGLDCNWAEREMLVYTVTYAPTAEGFTLELDIDGRVGSGFYDHVGRRGYRNIEEDFDEEFTRYANRIRREFRDYLLTQCSATPD